MADVFKTLGDLTTLNDKNAVDLGVTDLFIDAPLIKVLSATVASDGTIHKFIKESAAPTVGFRAINVGRSNSKSGDTLVTATLQLLDASFDVDKAMADSFIRGGADAFMAREAKRSLKAAMFALEKQILQGTIGGDAAGFTGIADSLSALANAFVLNAGGTTAATATSIYLIRHNNDGMDAQVVIGNDGRLEIDPYFMSTVSDSLSSRFTSYHQPILGYCGLQIGGAASIVRIGNITADAGKGATDALISKALALFPAARQPNVMAMGRRSLQQIQASRTATTTTGAPAPIPQDSFGIPIVVTDAIGVTEALLV
jgi:hypothetical protein